MGELRQGKIARSRPSEDDPGPKTHRAGKQGIVPRLLRLAAPLGGFVLFIICATLVFSELTLAQSEPIWQQPWAKTTTAAKKEGKIVVFGPAGELVRNTLGAAFKKSFPDIVFEYVGGRATEQATRLIAERDGGVFSVDVFIGGAVTMMRLGSYGAFESLEPALILPEVKDPKYWRDGRLEYTNPSTRYTLVFSSQPNPPVVYNLKQVRVNEIDELYELLDPKWKGQGVLNDPFPPGTGGLSGTTDRYRFSILQPHRSLQRPEECRGGAVLHRCFVAKADSGRGGDAGATRPRGTPSRRARMLPCACQRCLLPLTDPNQNCGVR